MFWCLFCLRQQWNILKHPVGTAMVHNAGTVRAVGQRNAWHSSPWQILEKKERRRATVVAFHLILGDIFLNNNSGTDSLYYQNASSKKEYIPCKIHPRLHHWDMEYFAVAEMERVILPPQTTAPFLHLLKHILEIKEIFLKLSRWFSV